jgi:lauroyl/myristoyl acyltransferase
MTTADSASIPGIADDLQVDGELAHFRLNLLTLFGGRRSQEWIDRMAHDAVEHRRHGLASMSLRLQTLRQRFDADASAGRCSAPPAPYLAGWDLQAVRDALAASGGAMLAVFHYGAHRQILADLACLQLPYVAPVAEEAYFAQIEAMTHAPPACRDAVRLLQVERAEVGRELLRALRSGRIGVIYVDGNMGPDGHLVQEGSVVVDFLGQQIRVKAGIARLATRLGLPIIPAMVVDAASGPAIRLGAAIDCRDPGGDNPQQAVMQTLYDHLARQVEAAPQYWEFAFCLHRWLEAQPSASTAMPAAWRGDERLFVDRTQVALYRRDEQLYWCHARRNRAYRIPPWAADLFDALQQPRSVAQLRAALPTAPADQLPRLLEQLGNAGLLCVEAG